MHLSSEYNSVLRAATATRKRKEGWSSENPQHSLVQLPGQKSSLGRARGLDGGSLVLSARKCVCVCGVCGGCVLPACMENLFVRDGRLPICRN